MKINRRVRISSTGREFGTNTNLPNLENLRRRTEEKWARRSGPVTVSNTRTIKYSDLVARLKNESNE